jgi:fructose-1,6-bisphosphatase II / sedoheptulose-1,7-bisphosphatase
MLDRPRHGEMIAAVRRTGAGLRLITDGDIAGVIFTTTPEKTGIDIYMGIGAAPEGVLAASALRCVGGQMYTRLILDSDEKLKRAAQMGVSDPKRTYAVADLARGDVIVAATGVTDGALVSGVRFHKDMIETDTVVYRSVTGTVRRVQAEHREFAKFHLG